MEDLNVVRQRSEIPVEDTWATEDLYPSDAAWREELKTLATDKTVLSSYAGRLGGVWRYIVCLSCCRRAN